jgi:hypothetical protein
MNTEITVFEKPITRIRDLMGLAHGCERNLPELETYLEGLDGETDEDRLTVNGLSFLKGVLPRKISQPIWVPDARVSRNLRSPAANRWMRCWCDLR